MRTAAIDACPACHSAAASDVRLGEARLRCCTSCGLVYAPEFANPEEVYVEGYFTGGTGQFGLDVRDPEMQAFLAYVGAKRMRILGSVVSPPGTLLDVGCGNGATLCAARSFGWAVTGVDLVPDAVDVAVNEHGLDVRNCLLEDSGLPERSFDVVMATHVLEHQRDGLAFLEMLGRWVRPNGHLLIEVPNWASVDRAGNADAWFGLRPLEHLAHYGPRTLAATMRRAGMKPVKVRTPCYQYAAATMPQAMHDLGLERYAWRLTRFTKPVLKRGNTVAMPNRGLRAVILAAGKVVSLARRGVVVVAIAQVP